MLIFTFCLNIIEFNKCFCYCYLGSYGGGKTGIATNVRGNRDLIQDGVNCILVPVNDVDGTAKAINRLSGDERLRKGWPGRQENNRKFSDGKCVERDG